MLSLSNFPLLFPIIKTNDVPIIKTNDGIRQWKSGKDETLNKHAIRHTNQKVKSFAQLKETILKEVPINETIN